MSDKETLYERSLRGCKKKEDISLYEEKEIKFPSIINDNDMESLGYCADKIKEVKIKDEIYPIYKISKPEKEKIEGYKTKKCEKNKKNNVSKKEPKDQFQKKKKSL